MTKKYQYLEVKKLETMKQIEEWLLKDFYTESKIPFKFKNTAETWKKLTDSKQAIVYIAKDDNKIVGLISGYLSPNLYNIEETNSVIAFMNVDKEYRGNGVSGKLYKLFEKWSKDNKVTNILTGVILEPAMNFYQKQGFNKLETTIYKKLEGSE